MENLEPDNKCQILELASSVGIDSVEAIYGELNAMATACEGQELVIDASQVEIITSPGVQLLVVMNKALEGKGGKIRIKFATEAMVTAFKTLGLSDALKGWSEENA